MNHNTTDINEQIISLRKEGMIQRLIAEKLSVGIDKVKYVLKKADVKGGKSERDCPCCGMKFSTVKSTAKFCSQKCRTRHYKESNASVQNCKGCGCSFKLYRVQEFCTNECRIEHYNKYIKPYREYKPKPEYIPVPESEKVCEHCEETYLTHNSNAKYCSHECGYECRYENEVSKRTVIDYECRECDEPFTSTASNRVYCSSECGDKYSWRVKEVVRRERLIENGPIDWDISIDRLIVRDGVSCHICESSVDVTRHTNHDYYPSVDHVIPVAKGGTHTWGNVKLAHRLCNSVKSDKLEKEIS